MNKQFAEDNVLPFLRKARGTEPPGEGKNWVSSFEHGTRFLAKKKHEGGSTLTDFVLMTDPKKMEGVILLGENINTREGFVSWRDPELFSNDYRFYKIIEILEPSNGNSDTIPTGPVASDAQSQDEPSVHEKE